jgi:hypothetical protein
MAEHTEESLERIRVRAYYLWLGENRPTDRDFDFWWRAEEVETAAAKDSRPNGKASAEPPKPAAASAPSHAGEAATSQISTAVKPALTDLKAELASKAAYFQDFPSDAPPFAIPTGMMAAVKTDETGVEYLALAHGDAAAPPNGSTGGYSVRVPDAVESAASGNRVIVRVTARTAGDGGGRFALAYSTNEVGNSGWRWFTTGPDWATYTLQYDVAPMIMGNGDYIGILPQPAGEFGVDLGCISVEVVRK